MSYFLNNLIVQKLIKDALKEDIGYGDITTNSLLEKDKNIQAVINSRSAGIVCGIEVLKSVYQTLDPEIKFDILVNDGEKINNNQDLLIIEGSARAILTGERTALNFIQRMSAIATLTNQFQETIVLYKAKVTDTRKTTPNFRPFEKYAVKTGGGSLHRFGLFDCVMIKDNHIQLAGSITNAVKTIRNNISHTTKIEVETETIGQVLEALDMNVDVIMLDNMTLEEMSKAVSLIQNKAITEASGNISLENINQVASTGVDYISTSTITAKSGILDIGLDM